MSLVPREVSRLLVSFHEGEISQHRVDLRSHRLYLTETLPGTLSSGYNWPSSASGLENLRDFFGQ